MAGVGDFDGDGKSDILWRNSATGSNAMWLMNGSNPSLEINITGAPPALSVAGIGDFDGDGKSDILWRNSATGSNAMWLMNGVSVSLETYIAGMPPAWSAQGMLTAS